MHIECNYCRGIKHLKAHISLTNGGAVIYASNGTFKTSLLDTLAGYSEGQAAQDVLHPERVSTFRITDDCGRQLAPDSIRAIKRSSDLSALHFYSDLLLASPDLKHQYLEISRDLFAKQKDLTNALVAAIKGRGRSLTPDDVTSFVSGLDPSGEFYDGVKVLISESKSDFDTSFLDGITYPELFTKQKENIIVKPDVTAGIVDYTSALSSMLDRTHYLADGFTYDNLKDLQALLNKCAFFESGHEITFKDSSNDELVTCHSLSEFNALVKAEIERAFATPEVQAVFDKVAKAFGPSRGAEELKKLFESHPSLLPEMKNPTLVKHAFYVKAITQLHELADVYIEAWNSSCKQRAKIRRRIKEEESGWEQAVGMFKARFSVPFEMRITNRDDVVIGDAVPALEFKHDGKVVSQEPLFNCLSTGEKNAMFLLYVIFEMVKIKHAASTQTQYVFFDDPVDSFDYKNKYAFVEYVRDFSLESNLKVIILTHNYDFLRALAGRLRDTFHRKDVLLCEQDANGGLVLRQAEYLANNVLTLWRQDVANGDALATIAAAAMVRELCAIKGDNRPAYEFLSSVLHGRQSSSTIQMSELEQVYDDYLGAAPASGISNRSFQDICLEECRRITSSQTPLDPKKLLAGKIALSIGIRILAERKILPIWSQNYSGTTPSIYGKLLKEVIALPFNTLQANGIGSSEISLLEEVALVVSSDIHLNAFMYEPIIDTGEWRLIELFKRCDRL